MYKIDWDKYLSNERFRKSTRKTGDGYAQSDFRSDFESDLGRVIFSSAVRRMHDKTQVIPLTSGDYVHTRLTHSMEVMSIAYSLGANYCRSEEFIELYGDESYKLEQKIEAILKTAAFVHDIGNPPFGHFGETIIQNYFKSFFKEKGHIISSKEKIDFEEFDGNAQGLRILTRLQYLEDLYGLNLTYATLAAYLKYPNIGKSNKKYIGNKKHGIYSSEKDIFEEIVNKCNLSNGNKIKRHPLSFLVEAADSICYLTMDMEDGMSMGWYGFEDIKSFLSKEIVSSKDIKRSSLVKYYENGEFSLSKFLSLSDKKKSEKAKMVDLRIKTISYFVKLAGKNFINNLKEIDNGSYSKELIDDDPFRLSEAFKKFAQDKIFPRKEIEQEELIGNAVLTGLLDKLIGYMFNGDKKYRKKCKCVLSKTTLNVAYHQNVKSGEDLYFMSDAEYLDLDPESLSSYFKYMTKI